MDQSQTARVEHYHFCRYWHLNQTKVLIYPMRIILNLHWPMANKFALPLQMICDFYLSALRLAWRGRTAAWSCGVALIRGCVCLSQEYPYIFHLDVSHPDSSHLHSRKCHSRKLAFSQLLWKFVRIQVVFLWYLTHCVLEFPENLQVYAYPKVEGDVVLWT